MSNIKIRTLSPEEVKEFVNSANSTISYKMVPHTWRTSKRFNKQYCSGCGLILLNNDFTRWSVNHGCLNNYHSGYNAARKRTKI